jgi:hypothetical protein
MGKYQFRALGGIQLQRLAHALDVARAEPGDPLPAQPFVDERDIDL